VVKRARKIGTYFGINRLAVSEVVKEKREVWIKRSLEVTCGAFPQMKTKAVAY
jgi:hypothetical protein